MHRLISRIRVLFLPRLVRARAHAGTSLFVRCFSYKDIKRATDGFGRIIASCNGTVYKAKFKDGLVAVVKEVRTCQGNDLFHRQVQLLGRLHHRHLVSLRGFSTSHKRFLVFEYMENGSLKEHLTDPLKTPLNWRTRLKIAIGVAAALEYLHFFCDPPVYHVSISSSSVLLDEHFVAKLSDVGLVNYCQNPIAMPHASCSRDCMDQERRKIIFQLGILILELITGQLSGKDGTDLVQWVQDQESSFEKSIHKIVDPDLGNSYDYKQLKCLLAVARLCTKIGDKPTFSIPQILRYLQRRMEASIPCA